MGSCIQNPFDAASAADYEEIIAEAGPAAARDETYVAVALSSQQSPGRLAHVLQVLSDPSGNEDDANTWRIGAE